MKKQTKQTKLLYYIKVRKINRKDETQVSDENRFQCSGIFCKLEYIRWLSTPIYTIPPNHSSQILTSLDFLLNTKTSLSSELFCLSFVFVETFLISIVGLLSDDILIIFSFYVVIENNITFILFITDEQSLRFRFRTCKELLFDTINN